MPRQEPVSAEEVGDALRRVSVESTPCGFEPAGVIQPVVDGALCRALAGACANCWQAETCSRLEHVQRGARCAPAMSPVINGYGPTENTNL